MKHFITLFFLLVSTLASAQTNRDFTQAALKTMLADRDLTTGVWEKAGWWNSANVMTMVLRYGQVTADPQVIPLAQAVLNTAKHYKVGVDSLGNDRFCENFNNDYYDDQGWWALAWIEAYKLSHDKQFLDMAETIYGTMSTGWSMELGGGIYWKKNPLQYKNAIANNLYGLLAARLYKLTQKEAYKTRFLEESDWMLQSGMINRFNWQVEDGLSKDGTPNRGQYYTYNQGVALAVLTERYELTGNPWYLQIAENIADATLRLMTTSDGVLCELKRTTEPSGDGVQFKGIFIRHLAYLYSIDKKESYKRFILKNASSITQRNWDEKSQSFGCYWYGPFEKVQPAANSCALDCMVEALALEQERDHTAFQTSYPWSERIDNRADIAIVYGVGGNPTDKGGKLSIEERLATWQEKGYNTQFMTGIAWGCYEDYFTGKYDGKMHLDEGQVQQNGDTIWHGRMVPYLVPSENFLKYFKEKHIKRVIDAGVNTIFLEEPEFWARAGYSSAFKKEWEQFYGFPWRPQHESAENTYLSNKLKYHLYYRALEEAFTYAKEYGKSLGRTIKCYVPTHSLVNYSQWDIVSPEASLASLPCVDGYIAQVWTGTSRCPVYYKGIMKERVFENAFLEYGSLESMTAPTGRRVYFLTDPIEDAVRDWEDYKKNYQATFMAKLLYPGNNYYEVMPWPERIYTHLYPKSANSTEKDYIPRFYSTQMQIMIGALNKMPVGQSRIEGSQGIYVMMANSLMFQRTPAPVDGYEDPQLANFHGLALPLLKQGVPVNIMHLENTGYADNWKDAKVLLMTYANMKPLQPEVHQHIANWVKQGGVLIYAGRDQDAFQNVQEWWNQGKNNYKCAADHLFQLMGLTAGPASGVYSYGDGKVYVLRMDPKEFVMQDNATQLLSTVKEAYEQQAKAGTLVWKNNLVLERGAYDLIAVMEESVSASPVVRKGLFIDLFDAKLPILTEKTVKPGEQAFLLNLERVQLKHQPQVLASAGREYQENWDGKRFTCVSKGPINTTNAMRVLFPVKPKRVKANGKNLPFTWDKLSHTAFVSFENNPAGVKLEIE